VKKKNILNNIFLASLVLFFLFNCYNAPPVLNENPSNLSAINRENSPPDRTALDDLDRAVSRARTAQQLALEINVPSHYPLDWATITTHFFKTEQQIMTSTLRETQEATARYYAMAEAFEAINLRTFVMYANLQGQAETDNSVISKYSDDISNVFKTMTTFNELADIDEDFFPQDEALVFLPQTGIPVIPDTDAQPFAETPTVLTQTATPATVAQRATPAAVMQNPVETPAAITQSAAPAVVAQADETPAPQPQQNAALVAAAENKVDETHFSSPQSTVAAAAAQSKDETPVPQPQQSAAPVVTRKANETLLPQIQSGAVVVVPEAVSEIPLLHEEPPVVEKAAVSNSAFLNTEPEQVNANKTNFLRLLIIIFSCIVVVCCVLFVSRRFLAKARRR